MTPRDVFRTVHDALHREFGDNVAAAAAVLAFRIAFPARVGPFTPLGEA